jgi:hypothetical protein
MLPQLLSGARAEIKIGTETIAFATDVSISLSHNVRPVHTFGAPNARSVEPLSVSPVQISVGRVFPVNKASAANQNDGKVDISTVTKGIEPAINQMLKADDIQIDLKDKITGATVATIKNCRFAGRSLSLSASQLATERLQFIGIYDAASGNTTDKLGF